MSHLMSKRTAPFSRLLNLFVMTAAAALLSAPAAMADDMNIADAGVPAAGRVYKDLSPALISLSRAKGGKPGDFIIRLTSRYGQSGCPHIGKVGYETEFTDMYLTVRLQPYAIGMTDLPAHPEYQCGGRAVYPAAEIPLSLDMLEKNGTTQIRFQDSGETAYYDVVSNKHSIELIEQKPAAQGAAADQTMQTTQGQQRFRAAGDLGNVKNPMKIWLYPENTVILRVSGAPRGADVHERLNALARAHSLAPLETVIDDFKSPIDDADSFYYVDTSKKHELLKKDGIGDGFLLDSFSVPSVVYGATGDETVDRPVQVFVHTPNVYE